MRMTTALPVLQRRHPQNGNTNGDDDDQSPFRGAGPVFVKRVAMLMTMTLGLAIGAVMILSVVSHSGNAAASTTIASPKLRENPSLKTLLSSAAAAAEAAAESIQSLPLLVFSSDERNVISNVRKLKDGDETDDGEENDDDGYDDDGTGDDDSDQDDAEYGDDTGDDAEYGDDTGDDAEYGDDTGDDDSDQDDAEYGDDTEAGNDDTDENDGTNDNIVGKTDENDNTADENVGTSDDDGDEDEGVTINDSEAELDNPGEDHQKGEEPAGDEDESLGVDEDDDEDDGNGDDNSNGLSTVNDDGDGVPIGENTGNGEDDGDGQLYSNIAAEEYNAIMSDGNVALVASIMGLVGFLLLIFVAQQMLENPDGCCVKVCICSIAFSRLLFWPCNKICGWCAPPSKRKRQHASRSNDYAYSGYSSDLELS